MPPIADVLLHSSATTLCANKRRVRSADDLSASTGSRRLRGTRFAGTPDLRWRSPINLSEHRIESPQATEACTHGDLRHREIGLVQNAPPSWKVSVRSAQLVGGQVAV